MGILRILSKEGDSKFVWDKTNKAETAGAKAQFDAMKAEGYYAYTVGKDGKPDKLIQKFDKNLEAIIMTPHIVGG